MKIPSPVLPERPDCPGPSARGMIADIVARIRRLTSSSNPHIQLLDQIISNQISLSDLTDRAGDIEDLHTYLERRVARMSELERRLKWIQPVPSRKCPMGF